MGELGRLWGELRPHHLTLVAAAALSLVVAAGEGIRLFLLQPLVDRAISRSSVTDLVLLLMGVTLAQGLAQALRSWLTRRPALDLATRHRQAIFDHLQGWSLRETSQLNDGRLASAMISDAEAVHPGVTAVMTLLQQPLTLVVLLVAALSRSAELVLVFLLGLPLVWGPVLLLRRVLTTQSQRRHQAQAHLHGTIFTSVAGTRSLQAAGAGSYLKDLFYKENEELAQAQATGWLAQSLLVPSHALGIAAATGAAVWMVTHNSLPPTAGELTTALASLVLLYTPVKSLAQVPLLLTQSQVGRERLEALLAIPSSVLDPDVGEDPGPGPLEIRWRGVEVRLGGHEVFHGVDLEVKAGEWVGITGPSGVGKSTLVHLVQRLLDPDGGTVEVGGISTRRIRREVLQQRVGLVPQEGPLLDLSLEENITLGRHFSPEHLKNIMELCGLGEFAHDRGGLRLEVGSRGQRLSAGQRQRVYLARVLVNNPGVLILDEGTSHLDRDTERQFLQALRRAGPRTVILISHHSSALAMTDRVVKFPVDLGVTPL